MKEIPETQYVDMTDVIGTIAIEYNLPYMRFEKFVELGKHVKRVYNLDTQANTILCSELCEYIAKYIQTPFGAKVAHELSLV